MNLSRILSVLGLVLFRHLSANTAIAQESDNLVDQETILLKFFDGTNGLRWRDRTNWLSDSVPVCQWYGISCYEEVEVEQDPSKAGMVKYVHLSDNKLSGLPPPILFDLPYLKELTLKDNPDMDFSFENIESATELVVLALSATGLSSVEGIGKAGGTLKSLHLTDIGLTGKIPEELYQLTGLAKLYCNYNFFSGPISPSIGNLVELRELFIYDNNLTGQLPTELGMLTSLEFLALADNMLTGTLPNEFDNLGKLEVMAVQSQKKNGGDGIGGTLPIFSGLASMKEMYLSDNSLTGSIPSNFLGETTFRDETFVLDLSDNRISGNVPSSLSRFERLKIYLADNKVEAISSSLCAKSKWMGSDVTFFACDAIACPPGTFNEDDGRQSSLESPCSQCKSGETSQYYGATECVPSGAPPALTQREILERFYISTDGEYWRKNNNWLAETVDVCGWYGVACTSGHVSGLSLIDNVLSGTPPVELFELPYLETLNLSRNYMDFSFSGIEKATGLTTVNLSSTGLSSVEGIENAQSLKTLDLQSNFLEGTIPDELFKLVNLNKLLLSHNKFSGHIPLKIGYMVDMREFHIYGSKLTGRIPSTLGILSKLIKLDLAENDFTGTLPTQLGNLPNLQFLSLHQTTKSGKGISGTLPDFADMSSLTELYLDSNALTGTIPQTLLSNSQKTAEQVTIGLSSNYFEGTIPSTLAKFDKLSIDLSKNRITHIPSALCTKSLWMNGGVASAGCDAILCPPRTHNEVGKKTSAVTQCAPCLSDSGMAPFFGTTRCFFDTDDYQMNSRDILEKLFFVTGGRNWIEKGNWLDEFVGICEWSGITCHKEEGMEGYIEHIQLNDNGLSGTPPSEIFQLPHLQQLNFKGNPLSFDFSGIGRATFLHTLVLSGTGLRSVRGLENAPALTSLHLTDNDLSGSFPHEILKLVTLKELYLNYNKLTGKLPITIQNMINLEELYLYENGLTGQIPAVIGNLDKLKLLTLAMNNFDGTLPEELNLLTDLQILSLEGNNKNGGEGISGPLLSFSSLTKLQEVFVNSNSITGTIPSSFLSGIEDKLSVVKADLMSNQIEGTIPVSLGGFQKLKLYIAGNKIEAISEDLCDKKEWLTGEVGSFGCDAIACPPNTHADIGRQSSGESGYACVPCEDSMVAPYYGSFECITDEGHQEIKERDILETFYHAMGGKDWTRDDNWLNPHESICDWYGVTCASGDKDLVEAIHLSKNALEGQMPTEIFDLPSLRELNLAGNPIEFTFDSIERATELTYLNLDSTGLESLVGVENAPKLMLLHAMSNKLSGSLPLEIFSLTALEVLFLSENSFSGELPEQMRSLSAMRFLSLSDCGLSGFIPNWIGDLSNLEYLQLDKNTFSGSLPRDLSNLDRLEYLDLSDQKSEGGPGLTGTLIDFVGMKKMTKIDLHTNGLTGTIPAKIFEDADTSSTFEVDFRSNRISGTIPVELSKFERLVLLLSGNRIENVPSQVCNPESLWMEGDVALFQCDGLLCPPNTFNELGRQAGLDSPCQQCDKDGEAVYYGTTTCGVTETTNPSASLAEIDILTHLYHMMDGKNWKNKENWLSGIINICEWSGITCHGPTNPSLEGKVKVIDLSDNNLRNAFPSKTFELEGLVELNVKGNDIYFPFYNIEKAVRLKELYLSETGLKSVEGVGKATGLTVLHLTDNGMMGTFPPDILELENLTELYMNYNKISGRLPPKIGTLTNLEELFMFQNDLSGQLPTTIGKLNKLRLLTLAENHITGTLPTELSNLVSLEIMAIQREGSGSSGEIMEKDRIYAGIGGPLVDLSGLTKLRELYLGSNQLTGTIPPKFLSGVADKSDIVKVDITMNKLQGEIPVELAAFDKLKIYLAGNRIGAIPNEICEKSGWLTQEVKQFGCDAILCPPNTYNDYGRQNTNDTPCVSCEGSSKSVFFGSLECITGPVEDLDERGILTLLYRATGGLDWSDDNKWLTDVSICEWFGVVCADDETNDRVVELRLGGNNLVGPFPSEIFQIPSLKVLDLHFNDIDFNFEGIGSATKLEELNLDSTRTTSLEGLDDASTRLSILHLERNNFGGKSIPAGLFHLIGLKQVYLSSSNFSGTLPKDIGNLYKLEEFYCSENNLTGKIPASIGNLDKLRVLALSENLLSEELPAEIGQLPKLQSLYLDSFTRDSKGITGPLPDFSGSPDLTELYIGYNSLTGQIPPLFLLGINDPMEKIRIGLSSNQLTGTVPSELKRFRRLDIDLSGNHLTGIAPELCDKTGWMDGAVSEFGCDAILCPIDTFNLHGRQSTKEGPCRPCDESHSGFLGSDQCTVAQRTEEMRILEKFYHVCGGDGWKNSEGWLDKNVDYCNWYGVSCHNTETVDSILMGSNNVIGTPPSEIFDLRDLKYLWLYSNPIQFKFDGIHNAVELTSLLLDSTGMESIEGIAQAKGLTELDLRFNRLSGPISEELFALQRLESLSLSDNDFSGTLPSSSFDNLSKLKKLRLGNNKLTGILPDFSMNSMLKSVDLSGNELVGPVPTDFLKTTTFSEQVFVDLSSNQLTGTVPGELGRFEKLTLYLRENMIESIDPVLCNSDMWNDGDVGDFGCDGIMCSKGTWSLIGRQSKIGSPCEVCDASSFYGSSTCGSFSLAMSAASSLRPNILLGFAMSGIICMACLLI